jgi:hypothetical protein
LSTRSLFLTADSWWLIADGYQFRKMFLTPFPSPRRLFPTKIKVKDLRCPGFHGFTILSILFGLGAALGLEYSAKTCEGRKQMQYY